MLADKQKERVQKLVDRLLVCLLSRAAQEGYGKEHSEADAPGPLPAFQRLHDPVARHFGPILAPLHRIVSRRHRQRRHGR